MWLAIIKIVGVCRYHDYCRNRRVQKHRATNTTKFYHEWNRVIIGIKISESFRRFIDGGNAFLVYFRTVFQQ